MAAALDIIGIVRQHRWVSADKQAEMLKPECRAIVSLGGGKVRRITRETIEKWSTPGRIFAFVHAFLLAEPSRRRLAGGLKADFRAALARIEKRGART